MRFASIAVIAHFSLEPLVYWNHSSVSNCRGSCGDNFAEPELPAVSIFVLHKKKKLRDYVLVIAARATGNKPASILGAFFHCVISFRWTNGHSTSITSHKRNFKSVQHRIQIGTRERGLICIVLVTTINIFFRKNVKAKNPDTNNLFLFGLSQQWTRWVIGRKGEKKVLGIFFFLFICLFLFAKRTITYQHLTPRCDHKIAAKRTFSAI